MVVLYGLTLDSPYNFFVFPTVNHTLAAPYERLSRSHHDGLKRTNMIDMLIRSHVFYFRPGA